MKRLAVVCMLVAAMIVPAAFAADPVPADFKNAAKYCKAVRDSKGVEAFQTQYGTNKNKKNALRQVRLCYRYSEGEQARGRR